MPFSEKLKNLVSVFVVYANGGATVFESLWFESHLLGQCLQGLVFFVLSATWAPAFLSLSSLGLEKCEGHTVTLRVISVNHVRKSLK